MTENRCKLARERAGLSLGQAAKLLGVDRSDVESIEATPAVKGEDAKELAELYGVNVEWLTGAVPQHDYEALKRFKGAGDLTSHDRDTIAEFAASMPRGTSTAAERLAAVTRRRGR